MKPYLIIDDHITANNKGSLRGSIYTRYITTADSVIRMLQRAYSFRTVITKCKFYIYDKNPKHIEMFKHMMTWDGEFDSFADHIKAGEIKLGITCKEYDKSPLEMNTQLGKIMKQDQQALQELGLQVMDFKSCWQAFQNAEFEFMEIDIIEENKKFINFLDSLEALDSSKKQYAFLGFNPENYPKEKYADAMNNILHLLWRKSFKKFTTKIDTVDSENKPYEKYAGEIYVSMHPTFCILPWMHIQYKPTGQSKLCCRYDNIKEQRDFETGEYLKGENLSELFLEKYKLLDIQNSSIKDTFSSSNFWNKARQFTIENKPIAGCHKCYSEEKIGLPDSDVPVSMRLGSSILYNDGFLHKKPDFEKPRLEFLEVGFGNYCNMACLTCNSTLSTTWYEDEVKLNEVISQPMKRLIYPKLDNLKFELEKDHLQTLKIIKFTGGEPMINPEFIKFIDHIVEFGNPENIALEIYTNCSYIPSPKLLENLPKFKIVQLNLSIDAMGSINDYIRYGSQWSGDAKQTVSNALDFWIDVTKKHNNIPLIMSTTLSILNVLEIPKLMTWWFDKLIANGVEIKFADEEIAADDSNDDSHLGFFKLQPVFDPNYLNLSILPSKYYSEVSEWIVYFRKNFATLYPHLPDIPRSIRSSLRKLEEHIRKSQGNINSVNMFLEYISKIDKIRNNSINNYLPHLLEKIELFRRENGN